jgi:hypothetical protein
MFRPIRVDHTNCLQVAIKTHSFITTHPHDTYRTHYHHRPCVLRYNKRFIVLTKCLRFLVAGRGHTVKHGQKPELVYFWTKSHPSDSIGTNSSAWEKKHLGRRIDFLHSACLANLTGSVGFILDKVSGMRNTYSSRLIYVVFHTSPSILSLSSCPYSSYSFPSLISSTI